MSFQVPRGMDILLDCYGAEHIDLDGDGDEEIVYLGDRGLSGPATLAISIDSKGKDAYAYYYARFDSYEIVKKGRHLYFDSVYTPYQQEPIRSRYEIRYDGLRVWIEDAQGVEVDFETSGINR